MYYYCNKIQTLLRAGLEESKVRRIFISNNDAQNLIPKELAEGNFIMICPTSSDTGVADSQKDRIEGQIEIIIGGDIQEDWYENESNLSPMLKVLDLMEGTDDNGIVRTDTVKYILRQYINQIGLSQSAFIANYENQRPEDYIYAAKFTITIYDQRTRYNS